MEGREDKEPCVPVGMQQAAAPGLSSLQSREEVTWQGEEEMCLILMVKFRVSLRNQEDAGPPEPWHAQGALAALASLTGLFVRLQPDPGQAGLWCHVRTDVTAHFVPFLPLVLY